VPLDATRARITCTHAEVAALSSARWTVGATGGGGGGGGSDQQHWCVHSECMESVTPFRTPADLAEHVEEAHGGGGSSSVGVGLRRVGEAEAPTPVAAAEPSDRWSAVRCAAPAIAQSVRTVRSRV
jgi:hypothetical protein